MDSALHLVRFLHYGAAMQLFGAAFFSAFMAPPGLRLALDLPLHRLSVASAWLLALTAIAWLALTAAGMAGGLAAAADPNVLGTVLARTAFGRVWALRLMLLAIVLLAAHLATRRGGWVSLALLSMLALGSLGLVGHAAADTGLMGLLHQSSQALHLVSSGFWLGSLIPLLFCLRYLRDPALSADADIGLRRFSGLGHLAVAVALGTGVLTSWIILRETALDLASPYQGMLVVKVALVGVMVFLATVNRYVFVPRIPNDGPGLAELRKGTIAEIALAAGVVGLVSVFGTLPPAG